MTEYVIRIMKSNHLVQLDIFLTMHTIIQHASIVPCNNINQTELKKKYKFSFISILLQ